MSLAQARRYVARSRPSGKRFASSQPGSAEGRQQSAHAQWYAEMLPGMVPVALLGSAVYMGLRLLQSNLAHERYLDETRAKVQELEREVEALRRQREQGATAAVTATVEEPKSKGRGWLW